MLSTEIFIFISSFIVIFSADTSALPSLSLRVHGPQIVYAVENLVLITNISNTGNETLKLLNDPQGLTSKTPTNKFDIRSSAGERPLFTGIEVDYDPFKAANTSDHDAFTVLAPGESISVEHDLSEVYNFSQVGCGSYSFEPHNLLYYVEPSISAIVSLHAEATAHRAWISGKLAFRRDSRALSPQSKKRINLPGCTTAQHNLLQIASSSATNFVAGSVVYMQNNPSPGIRYTTWFGDYDLQLGKTVSSVFTKLEKAIHFTFLTYDCSCTVSNQYAWVTRSTGPLVHICPRFWTVNPNEMAGILIMEATHWTNIADAHDFAWSSSDCKALALSDPSQAVDNAASFAFFAVNDAGQEIP